MLLKTTGILLHTFRYNEKGMVAHFYTRDAGRMEFFLRSMKSHRSNIKPALLMPLSILDLEAEIRNPRELQRIVEMKPFMVFSSLPFNIVKSAVAMFIAEMLYRLLKEHAPNHSLFGFLIHTIQSIDTSEKLHPSFIPLFLISLARFLGIRPSGTYSSETPVFDLLNGVFIRTTPDHPHFIRSQTAFYFYRLLHAEENNQSIELPKHIRDELTDYLIRFFQLHYEGMGQIKSYPVIQQVFNS